MPRIRGAMAPAVDPKSSPLVDRLQKSLEGDAQDDGPVIFEIPTGRTGTFHIIVVWESWENLAPDDRVDVILEAYRRYDASKEPDDRMSPRITLVIGATPDSAIHLRLLPYPVWCNANLQHFESIRKLMRQEGAIETSSGFQLRFPTIEMARAASERLRHSARAFLPDVDFQVDLKAGLFDDD